MRAGSLGADGVRALREQLVDHLLDTGRIHSDRVAEAFQVVPRHVFLPGVEPTTVYTDEAIPTKRAPDGRAISSSSQPSIMAIMLEQLCVEPGHQVREIGAGTGYNAALLAFLVGETGALTTVDIDQDLVEQARDHLAAAGVSSVRVVCGDGANGYAESAPYDRIMLTVGADDVAPAWVDQLASAAGWCSRCWSETASVRWPSTGATANS